MNPWLLNLIYSMQYTNVLPLYLCVFKSQTSSEDVRVWNRRSVVWTGPQRCGALASTEHLSVRRGMGGVWLVHLPEVWRSEASRAGRIGCCRWSKPSAGFPETWCSLLESEDHHLHCHFHSLAPRTTASFLPPGPKVCALAPPRKSASRTGSCLDGGKDGAAPPLGHLTRGCQVYQASCWNRRSWTQILQGTTELGFSLLCGLKIILYKFSLHFYQDI